MNNERVLAYVKSIELTADELKTVSGGEAKMVTQGQSANTNFKLTWGGGPNGPFIDERW